MKRRLFSLCFFIVLFPFFALSQDTQGTRKSPFNEEQDYIVAVGLFRDSLFQLAEAEFDSFLRTYPKSIHTEEVFFLRNECLFFEGKYEEAAQGYSEYITRFPQSSFAPKSHFRKGESLLRQKKYTKAVETFKGILEKYPDSDYVGEAAYWVGESYAGAGEYQDAIKYYNYSYEQGERNRVREYAIYSLAWTYQQLRMYRKALAWYDTLRVTSESKALLLQACIQSADCYAHLSEYTAALAQLQQCESQTLQEDEAATVQFLLAEYLYQSGQYAEAQKRYELFLQKYSASRYNAEVRYGLAWSLSKQREYKKALVEFAAVAETNSALSIPAKYEQARTYQVLAQSDSALILYLQIAELPAHNEWRDKGLFEAGRIYYEKRSLQKARDCFQTIVSKKEETALAADAYRWLGESAFLEKKYDEAAAYYARVVSDTMARDELRSISLYQLGRSYFLLKHYAKASEYLTTFVTSYPTHELAPEAFYWLSEAEYQRGNYTASLKYYKTITTQKKSPYLEQAQYGIGWSYYKLNQFNDAIEAFEKLLILYPKGKYALDARLRIADAYYAQKEYKKAAANYRLAIRLFPDSAGIDYAYYQAGQSFYRLQDYSEAYKTFEALVKTKPRSAYADDAQYAMGFINLQRREFGDALKDFQTLIQKYPASDILPKGYYSLGDCYYNMKNYAAARRSYEEILRRFPFHDLVPEALNAIYYTLVPEQKEHEIYRFIDEYLRQYGDKLPAESVLLKKAELLRNEKKYDAAAEVYKRFTDTYPSSPKLATAVAGLAESYMESGNTSQAIAVYERIARDERFSKQQQCRARLKIADIFFKEGNYEKALENLKVCVLSAETAIAAEAYSKIGQIYEAQGKDSEARTLYESALKKFSNEPSVDVVRLALAQMYVKQGTLSDAQKLLEQVTASRKDTLAAEAYCILGDISLLQKNYSEALKLYLRVKYLFPSHDEYLGRAYLGMGKAYEGMHESAQARKMYEAVRSLKVSQKIRTEAQTNLEKLQ